MNKWLKSLVATSFLLLLVTSAHIDFDSAFAHGDVAPQPMNTDALPDMPNGDNDDWLTENPYRNVDEEVWLIAIGIGASGYNQNCARCHGLEGISGGLAPDLRYLEAEEYGDEWYMERFRNGVTQNGITKMPAFGELLGQKAAWAIRTYVETRPDDGALDDYTDELNKIKNDLIAMVESGTTDQARLDQIQESLTEIAGQVETGSGFEKADSSALQALYQIDSDQPDLKEAADILTIGLSVAQ